MSFRKFTTKDPEPSLHFSAKLVSDYENDSRRPFAITFSQEENDVRVWETKTNGFLGGMFYKTPHIREDIREQDFTGVFIGGIVEVNGRKFQLTNCPEETMEIMEKKTNLFPKSNISLILEKIREKNIKDRLEDSFTSKCITGSKRCKIVDAEEILRNPELDLVEQEVITIIRKYRFHSTPTFMFDEFINSI